MNKGCRRAHKQNPTGYCKADEVQTKENEMKPKLNVRTKVEK